MLSIQEGASILLSDNPKGIYFLTGPEYGVKKQYIDNLSNYYDGNVVEYESLDEVVEVFKKKSLVPRKDSLYIVRYDSEFTKGLSEFKANTILKLNFQGTVLGIFDSDSDESKLDKYFKDNTIRINHLTRDIRIKHLKNDYPEVNVNIIECIASYCEDYYEASNVCNACNFLGNSRLQEVSTYTTMCLFGYGITFNSEKFKQYIVSKKFKYLMYQIDSYDGDYSNLFYDIFSALLDIAKVIEKPYTDSYAKGADKIWTMKEVKYLFNTAYTQLNILRNNSSYSAYNALIYVCSLLNFRIN